MSSSRKAVVFSLVLALTSSTAAVAWRYMPGNEVSSAFCWALRKPETYEKKNLEHYSLLVPGKNGWVFRTENDIRQNWSVNDKTAHYLLSLQKAFKSRNADLVVVMPPVRGMVQYAELSQRNRERYGLDPETAWESYQTSLEGLRRQGVNIVGVGRQEVTPDFFYKRNHHWTATGARITAKKTAAFAKNLGIYSFIPKKGYETSLPVPIAYQSSFEKAFKTACNSDLPDETAERYTTGLKSSAISQNSLFGDGGEPQVVLLGTSNSVAESSEANFEGFLKEYLSADVLNYAYVGAGIDTSIISYLNSAHFANGQPKIVIWEVPGYYDFNVMDDKLFNQVIPAAYGACPAPAHREKFAGLSGESMLMDLERTPLTAQLPAAEYPQAEPVAVTTAAAAHPEADYYIHLSFDDPVKEEFSLAFEYEDGGGTKTQDFGRSDRYPHDGEFYTLFPRGKTELRRIKLDLPPGFDAAGMTFEICPLPDSKTGSKGTANSLSRQAS